MLTYNSVISELDRLIDLNEAEMADIDVFLDTCNDVLENAYLTEVEYNKVVEHLKLEIMDADKFVVQNECKECTNPVFFARNNIPTSDGLLSNEIFGITRDERAGIFAYINLGDYFIDPSCYKTWVRMDSHIKEVIHGMDTYIVNDKGEIVSDPKGTNGIKFIKKNINKIKFKSTDSVKRDIKIQYLEKNKNRMFINKYIVIPPFYRDTNTGKGGTVGVGGVNVLYRNLILAVQALSTTQDYGFDNTGSLTARIQETLLQIYDWFCGNTNPSLTVEPGVGISKKKGILRMANMSKTTNYSSRMVISAPELKAETVDDMMVDFDHSAIPLAAALANYRSYILFNARRFFENEFQGNELYPVLTKDDKKEYVMPKDPMIEFSDERIKREMDRFLHGYSNRFVPIKIPVENSKKEYYMAFKGRYQQPKTNVESVYNRWLTWCDIFYICAVEASMDKNVLVSRYPIDNYFNQITTKVVISSTKDTEPVYIEDKYYPYYPRIRQEDIGKNTNNSFVDTFKLSNLYLDGLGGDYDGDTITCKSPYTVESLQELDEYMNSKANFINLGCSNIKLVDSDVSQSLFSLTRVLIDSKPLTQPSFG